MKRAKRSNPEVRKSQILNAAIKTAVYKGYRHITIPMVAHSAGVSRASVLHYFNTILKLKRLILKTAIEKEIFPIIIQAIGMRDLLTLNLSDGLKQKLVDYLNKY